MQKNHDFPHDLLLVPCLDDAFGADRPDAGHFPQPGRILLDYLEHVATEFGDELLGVDGTDTGDGARTQVLLDPRVRFRSRSLDVRGLELAAMRAVVHPMAGCRDPLARAYRRRAADYRLEFAQSPNLHS